jgi:hypothetical protein
VPENPDKVVIAHWHFYKRSFDNQMPEDDDYSTDHMAPINDWGGDTRDRPIGRDTIHSADWRDRDMQDEIEMAMRMGIDCFQMSADGDDVSANSATYQMLQAAANHGGGFKILLSASKPSLTNQQFADFFNAFRDHPNVLRHSNGDLCISSYAPDADEGSGYRIAPSRWTTIVGLIEDDGEQGVFFMPTIGTPATQTLEDYAVVSGALSVWRGNKLSDFNEPTGGLPVVRDFCLANDLEFMSQVMPQDVRPPTYGFAESRGSRNYITGWEFAIAHTGRYMMIGTWNDYAESHHVQPSQHTQFGFADLTRYYASWLKAGTQPAIVRDVLYYFYRLERTDAAGTGAEQPQRFTLAAGSDGPFEEIELLAFLTAPGRLHILDDGVEVAAQDVSSGIQRLRTDWFAGVPSFKFTRGGSEVITLTGAWATRTVSDYQEPAYRSGCSSRPMVPQF